MVDAVSRIRRVMVSYLRHAEHPSVSEQSNSIYPVLKKFFFSIIAMRACALNNRESHSQSFSLLRSQVFQIKLLHPAESMPDAISTKREGV